MSRKTKEPAPADETHAPAAPLSPQEKVEAMNFDEVKAHPAVQEFMRKRIESSDAEVRHGPGGSWTYNESKREGVLVVNKFLHAIRDL